MVLFHILTLLLSLQKIVSGIYVDVISDMLRREGQAAISEFSCDKSESVKLFKKLNKQGNLMRILSVNFRELVYPIPPNRHIFILNLQCDNSSNVLKRSNARNLFAFPFQWMLYLHNSSREVLEYFLLHIDILADSNVNLLHLHENESVHIDKVYKRQHNLPLIVEKVGHWTSRGGFKDYGLELSMWRRRNNLEGIILNTCIVITNNDSLNHLIDKRDKHIDSIAKVNYVLVEHLSDIVNVTLNYSIQSTWGYMNNKSEWSGMIGELTRNEADIGGTALFFTIDRVDIIDYIAMTTPTRSKFVFREPKLSYVTNVFTLPFDDYVWASTVALVIIIAMILFIIIKWELKKKNYQQKNKNPVEPGLEDSVSGVALFSFGAFCQQGAPSIPLSIPGRITTIMLFISFMFLYTSYSANIVALLQSSSTSIQTLEDLLKSRLQVGVDDTVFNRFYFPNASEPTRRAIYLQKVAPPNKEDKFMPIEVGVRRMREGLFAFHMETGPGYKLVAEIFEESEKCGLTEIQFLQVIDPWLAIQKNSSFKKYLKIGLRKIQESGLQAREVGLIYTKKPICINRGSTFISVGLVDCYPAAVVLASGAIISVLVLLMELVIHHRNALKKMKKLPPWPFLE